MEQRHGEASRFASPWVQLVFGVICMAMIANMQYGWTLFVNPINEKHQWGRAAIQVAFTIFVVTETWLVPVEGYLVDKFGPKPVVVSGGVLCALAWVLNSMASSLSMLYVGAAVGGIGAGAVYGTCVGNALKWFPDRRGLAAGITAAGFGAGSAATVIPIANMIKHHGYEATFLWFGLGQGLVVFVLGLALVAPPSTLLAPVKNAMKRMVYNAGPREVLSSPIFWVMYAMFVMMAAGGLMATAQLGPIAKDFGLQDTPVSLIGLTLPALTFALAIDRVLNGLTRPFFGWVSDRIGRENTMFVAFAIEAFGIVLLSRYGHSPVAFVVLTGIVFFAWGEIYSLFPATCGDTFGPKFAATNAGLLYTAKGTAALLVPLSSVITAATGSWHAVFMLASAMAGLSALMALFVLKPLRNAHRQKHANDGEAPVELPSYGGPVVQK
ncbi:oxalate/formate MFS antiporter [Paraburkholderia caballeronis]|uniref:MFS transporter, OFA family, oxalate/formate antiporter n=1 Tax=Paraburkholderia caballeronis TaxID=416943 RepID=A0A1H7QNH8_9BURK|nr:oxalate/formate MFS antiporter [Paraburkholderia caballeronis]PXW22461.1 OFA family oxalate/formate antiporter-like MFS transporter [Paraburkholderia caballeronis]PXW96332.1 OFA family oxalate/formate antiporter-like MFS transporter [Paraburkholderia caballeronis]RAJ92743.1 OFA family oxalate/formate antiporter-like MFS transporter [Paraburkholderia caballeronis]TDV15098.1 OFA family oxalate/formate antiporter-like MFS transporter [Paraburkholderia caballeronis]TDV16777.1 OFA family oxalate